MTLAALQDYVQDQIKSDLLDADGSDVMLTMSRVWEKAPRSVHANQDPQAELEQLLLAERSDGISKDVQEPPSCSLRN